jgi:hypothetical protein
MTIIPGHIEFRLNCWGCGWKDTKLTVEDARRAAAEHVNKSNHTVTISAVGSERFCKGKPA